MTKQSAPISEKGYSTSLLQPVPFSSNEIRLSPREWLIVLVLVLPLLAFVPALWERIEKFAPTRDYRLPYQLSEDYWMYRRRCRRAAASNATLVIGDSVIWGHYVKPDQTLSHHLNQFRGEQRFVNLGVDGIHPAALAGLLKYYGKDIQGKNVILHFNPLWLSSPKHDLQAEQEFRFNHPQLVPQFFPPIPCYRESFSQRFALVVNRYSSFLSWKIHLQIAYFENLDLAAWTLEHPYQNPLQQITLKVPPPKDIPPDDPLSWIDRGIEKHDLPWVNLETSVQWRSFRQSLEILRKRHNRVLVLVGPFNEHLLKQNSLQSYQNLKSKIETWLRQNKVAYFLPSTLPSHYYADASHPLSPGYALLAEQLAKKDF